MVVVTAVCTSVSRPEDNLGCNSPDTAKLFIGIGSLTGLALTKQARLASDEKHTTAHMSFKYGLW